MASKPKMSVERYPVDRAKLKEACSKAGTTIAKLGLSLGLSDSYFDNRIIRNQLDKQNILFLESELGITYDQIKKDANEAEPKKEADPVYVELLQQLIQGMRKIELELREIKEQQKEMMAQQKEMKEVQSC